MLCSAFRQHVYVVHFLNHVFLYGCIAPPSPPPAGPVETSFGTHLIYVESCNKPQNTWKMLYDNIAKKFSGEGDE